VLGGSPGGAGAAVLAGAPVSVEARPLTQQGIGGLVKPGTASSGRQVLDRNYFISQLRQKRQEIVNATHQLQQEVEELQQRQAAATRASRRADELQQEVRALQEALADANIVLDKAGSHAPLDAIAEELDAIRARNQAQRIRAESMATERMALEARTRQAEAQAAELEAAAEARMGSMPPGQRATYQVGWARRLSEHLAFTASSLLKFFCFLFPAQALQQEREGLLAEAAARDAAIEELDQAVLAAEGQLGRNPAKTRALELQASDELVEGI